MSEICPVCLGDKHDNLYPDYHGVAITSDMQVLHEATLANRCCRGCGLIWNAKGTRSIAEDFYRSEYRLMLSSRDAAIRNFSAPTAVSQPELALQLLRELLPLPPTGKLFELGSGKGDFLARFLAAFDDWEACALEPSDAFEMLRQRLPDVETHRGRYQDFPTHGRSFDLVVALGVLEHVDDPLSMLRWSRSLLRDGGRVMLMVPSFDHNPNDLFCADHLSKLTEATLGDLASRAGLEIVAKRQAGMPLFLILSKQPGEGFARNGVYESNRKIASRNVALAKASVEAVLRARGAARESGERFAIFGLATSGLFSPFFAGFDPGDVTAFIDENTDPLGQRDHRPAGTRPRRYRRASDPPRRGTDKPDLRRAGSVQNSCDRGQGVCPRAGR